ncbi:hypothetical protein [Paenibacillus amylolyticus]|uniref:Uncharacterized protein n=1 Tax=Paenibacillus amylolyticus TaxID=1451 RepID=A0ABD8B2Q7_PAEAM
MINEIIGAKATLKNNEANKILCSQHGLKISEVTGYIEKVNAELFVNVNGNRLEMNTYKGWEVDSNAERQFTKGTKVRLMEAPINQAVCESINRLDLIGFKGEVQYLNDVDSKDGYYVVGEKEIIYMRDFPRWEFL